MFPQISGRCLFLRKSSQKYEGTGVLTRVQCSGEGAARGAFIIDVYDGRGVCRPNPPPQKKKKETSILHIFADIFWVFLSFLFFACFARGFFVF